MRNLVAVDKDRTALSELVRRKYDFALNKGKARRRLRGAPDGARLRTTLHALVADLAKPHAQTADRIRAVVGFPKEGADTVVCNLAVHYLTGTTVQMHNFAALCRGLVKPGGEIIITTMFGLEVFRLLTAAGVEEGGTWDIFQEGGLKFSIRRHYASSTLTDAGQKIGVLLPFSGGSYYEEYLVNVRALTDAYVRRGFRVVETPLFSSHFRAFQTRNSTMDKLLTDGDRKWLSLYGTIRLRRKK